MKTLNRGVLISVEGVDGSGKSTLVTNIVSLLQEGGYPAVATREPGATSLGSIIRGIVQKSEVARIPKAEYLLFAADRAQHFHEIVIPALVAKKLVISDRMTDSSLVYQGYARGLDISMLTQINQWTMDGYSIDRTLYVKITAETAAARLAKRAQEYSVFEGKMAFTQKLIMGFDELFAHDARVHIIDGTLDADQLAHSATQGIIEWMSARHLLQ